MLCIVARLLYVPEGVPEGLLELQTTLMQSTPNGCHVSRVCRGGGRRERALLAMPAFDDLLDQIEMPQCHCLNASTDHTLRHCLEAESRTDPSAFLESDADEELLISVKFMQAVRISGIVVEGVDPASAPKDLKLFVNKVGLDFDSAKSDKATQEIALSPSDVAGKRIELRFVNFQAVQELGIFIAGNQGDEEITKVSKIAILGELVDQKGLKRSAEQQEASSKGDWLGKGIS